MVNPCCSKPVTMCRENERFNEDLRNNDTKLMTSVVNFVSNTSHLVYQNGGQNNASWLLNFTLLILLIINCLGYTFLMVTSLT